MVENQRISEFLDMLSSKQPVPGGGGASALGGALGTALGQMVGNLTIGKKKYQEAEEEMKQHIEKLITLQNEMLRLAEEDARVFAPLAAAYSLPCKTEEEKEYKDKVMEENLLKASLVPLEVMERSVEALTIMEALAARGSRMAVSDVGVGVQFLRTSLLGAVMNVYINTKSMKNREKAEELNDYADSMIEDGMKQADNIYRQVLSALK